MIRALIALLAAASPAAAQTPPLSFDAGKSLALANGQWSYSATASGSEARYGTHLLIQCDRATRTISISRPNLPVAALAIATDTTSQSLPPNGRISAQDPLLDAIAFSRGRFLISGGAGPNLAVPSWPEAARAIEDCRN